MDFPGNVAQSGQRLFILTLEQEYFSEPKSRLRIAWVDGKCLFQFLKRLVKKPNVSIDNRKLISRLIQTRVQAQRAVVFLNGLVVREMIGRRPEQAATSQVCFG